MQLSKREQWKSDKYVDKYIKSEGQKIERNK
jgi:hypothetical protein